TRRDRIGESPKPNADLFAACEQVGRERHKTGRNVRACIVDAEINPSPVESQQSSMINEPPVDHRPGEAGTVRGIFMLFGVASPHGVSYVTNAPDERISRPTATGPTQADSCAREFQRDDAGGGRWDRFGDLSQTGCEG